MAALEDQDFLPRPLEVRGIDQAVVAAADDDRVVLLRHACPSQYLNRCRVM